MKTRIHFYRTSIATLLTGFALAASPLAARADTLSDLQARVQALLAQIQSLQAGQTQGVSGVIVFTRPLGIGSAGGDVVALQNFLISRGYAIPAGPTGRFGYQTRAALAAFQAANAIYPVTGFLGPITRARINGMVAIAPQPSPQPGPVINGAAGTLTSFSQLGDVETAPSEGGNNIKVLGLSMRARGSDMNLQRVDVTFDLSQSQGSSNLSRYIDGASLYLNGQRLATLDATDADRSGRVWTMRFSNLNGVIRQNMTGELYVRVNTIDNVSSSEDNQNIVVSIPADGIRAADGEGQSETYSSGSYRETFAISTAAGGTLSIWEAPENPDDRVIQGDTGSATDGVVLTSFNLRAREQNVTVYDIPVTLNATGVANAADIVQNVSLERDGRIIRTQTVPYAGTHTEVVFANMNDYISQDTTATYTVVANIRRMNSGSGDNGRFDSGDSLSTLTSSSAAWDAEDSTGNSVSPRGTVAGGTATFQTTGIAVSNPIGTYLKSVGRNPGEGDQTQYSVSFRITAGDSDLYIDRHVQNALNPSATGGGVAWATTTSSTAGVTTMGAANLSSGGSYAGDSATSYRIPAGQSRTFTLNVTLIATATGFTGIHLTGINWDTQPNTNASGTYYLTALGSFRTADVSMTTH